MSNLNWETISSQYLFNDLWFKVRRDKCRTPAGKIVDPYYVYEFPTWVTALPVTEEGKVVMVRQYRHALGETCIEIPGGCVDDTDPDFKYAIQRELLEETGYSFSNYEYLGKISANPSTNNNLMHMFLEKIAREKAGIIKPGVPVVVGEELPETKPVFINIADEKKSPLHFANDIRTVNNWSWEDHNLILEVAESNHTDHKKYVLDLGGIYQAKNLVTVLAACSILQSHGWKINEQSMKAGLRHVKKLTGLHGRWEIIHSQPLVVLDVAHNPEGIRQLLQQIEITEHHELHIILGMVNDKDISTALAEMPQQAVYYFTKAQITRLKD